MTPILGKTGPVFLELLWNVWMERSKNVIFRTHIWFSGNPKLIHKRHWCLYVWDISRARLVRYLGIESFLKKLNTLLSFHRYNGSGVSIAEVPWELFLIRKPSLFRSMPSPWTFFLFRHWSKKSVNRCLCANAMIVLTRSRRIFSWCFLTWKLNYFFSWNLNFYTREDMRGVVKCCRMNSR